YVVYAEAENRLRWSMYLTQVYQGSTSRSAGQSPHVPTVQTRSLPPVSRTSTQRHIHLQYRRKSLLPDLPSSQSPRCHQTHPQQQACFYAVAACHAYADLPACSQAQTRWLPHCWSSPEDY